ncbi:hypothetical protein [Desulfocurvus sp. DL9XJH121]
MLGEMKNRIGFVLAMAGLLLLAAVSARGEDWGDGKYGIVPRAAQTVDFNVYAAKAEIPTPLGVAFYPAVVKKGGDARVLARDGVRHRTEYSVFTGSAHWCEVKGNAVPHGAVVFGDNGGPVYLVRAGGGDTASFGSQVGDGAPVLYRGDEPVEAESYMMLCR